MRLSITIPAYNEERAIAAIVERCLAARPVLLEATDLDEVEIIVVSDGSTDRTAEIAGSFADDGRIRLISYERNRGYGAALKRGFRESSGDLVGFLDADGTCDPLHFVHLVNACVREGVDIACGCRMTKASKMPRTRRLGNRIFRSVINFLAKASIRDAASGMRVIRRESLPRIYPLPDGLHFTPAMSCRASLDETLTMTEIDMAYQERIGESKLSVVRDGARFLKVILDTALLYRPFRMFGSVGLLLLLVAAALGGSIAHAKFVSPGYEHLPQWYLFRMMTALAAGSAGLTLLMVGLVAERVAVLVQRHQPATGFLHRVILPVLRNKTLLVIGALTILLGVVLNVGTLGEWIKTGHIQVENWWAYVITGGFLVITGAQLMALSVLDRLLLLLAAGRNYMEFDMADDLRQSANS